MENREEKLTGHWISNQNGTFTCDVCGCMHSRSNYCPNCGAEMSRWNGTPWIFIEDDVPINEEPVLTINRFGDRKIAFYISSSKRWFEADKGEIYGVIAWMKIPVLPLSYKRE